MAFDQDDLVACLALTEVEPGVVEGRNLDIGYHRVFGGQILAQVVAAAAAASPEKAVKSIHVLFPREGDTTKPMRYRVTKLQDGRTFGSTEVVAEQGDKVISVALVSMHVGEDGLQRSDRPATSVRRRRPRGSTWGWSRGRPASWTTSTSRTGQSGPPRLDWWMRAAPVSGALAVHQALLAHATDLTLIGTALRPFEGISQADSTVTLHTAVTSHTVWFHQPFRVDAWLQVGQHSPVVAGGRSYGRGDVFAGGELVASFAQEAMVRRIPG